MLVGLGGYAKSGKDAVADFLVEDHGFVKTYMSKPLEKALLAVNPWVNVNWKNWVEGAWWNYRDALYYHDYMLYRELHARLGYDASKNNKDVRNYLQRLGTEVGRDMLGPNVWSDIAVREIKGLLEEGRNVAITGMRFPNEMAMVKEFGGTLIWVSRPGYGPVNAHASDNTVGPDDFAIVIDNDGTLEKLRATTATIPMIEDVLT